MNKEKINKNWMFTKVDQPENKQELVQHPEFIDLPHSFNTEDGQDGSGMWKGRTWYQKVLHFSEEEIQKRIYLEIGAASLQSEVYVNGQLLEVNQTGFSMYRVELTGHVTEGDNLLSIMVSNLPDNNVYPLMGDFSFYGGIYRDCYLVFSDDIHFDLLDKSRDGIAIFSKKISKDTYELSVKGTVVNELSTLETVRVAFSLYDRENHKITETLKILEVVNEKTFSLKQEVKNPNLWNGVEDPYLYTLKTELFVNDVMVDQRINKIGFRTVEITPDQGVLLNGKPIKLKGVSRHQDFGGVGPATTREMLELDMEFVKEIGANSVRLSHYQHPDYFYTLCDEAGILVWTEIPFNSIPTTSDPTNQNAKDQLECLIKQTQNHPSVYAYGIQNEITIAVENERIHELTRELHDFAKKLDPTRYTSQANIYSVKNTSPINEITDFVGYNLYYGWYYGELEEFGERMDQFHQEMPHKPVMVTEYGVDANPQFHSYTPKMKDYTEEYQVIYHDSYLKAINSRDYLLGGYVWNLFDFGSDHRDEGGKKGKNQKGLVTIDRKTKKDAFYLYKAYWSKEPFVKIAESRFVKRHQSRNDIKILSNLEHFHIKLNDTNLGTFNSEGPLTVIKGVEFVLGDNVLYVEAKDADGQIYEDKVTFIYQKEQELNYVFQNNEQGKQNHVTNWFEKFDLSGVKEVELKEGYYSTYDTIEDLLEHPESKKVVEKYFEDLLNTPRIELTKGLMTLESLAKLRNLGIPKELLTAINAELNQIKK